MVGNTNLNGNLGVQQSTTLNNTLAVTGATTLSSTLAVTGTTTLSGAVTASSTLGVTGATTLSSTLGVTGPTTLSGTLAVTGTTTLSSTLTAASGIIVNSGGINAPGQTITASQFTGNAATATLAANLNRGVIAGNGLTGGGSLNGQDVTLNVGTGDGISIGGDSIAVDGSVVRTSGNQTIGGTKTFTSTIVCTADIIAFASDERLKTNIEPLENALDKVLTLSGFTYTFNEIGESLGFDTTITYVGVSAQQVQAVLPEAVKPAPANEDYLTVQYEKIVPLLIEAIKELKAEIDELKKINN